jgi:hypothetical protein
MKYPISEHQYVITEKDVVDILIAYNNQDYEWIIYFFETLTPIDIKITGGKESYTYEQLLANAGLQ